MAKRPMPGRFEVAFRVTSSAHEIMFHVGAVFTPEADAEAGVHIKALAAEVGILEGEPATDTAPVAEEGDTASTATDLFPTRCCQYWRASRQRAGRRSPPQLHRLHS